MLISLLSVQFVFPVSGGDGEGVLAGPGESSMEGQDGFSPRRQHKLLPLPKMQW